MIEKSDLRNQKNFRVLLGALGRPGLAVRLETNEAPWPLAAALAVGTCLLDHEVSLCVVGSNRGPTLFSALTAATGVRADTLEQADFVFVADGRDRRSARRAKHGSPEAPQDGATLVYCLDGAPANSADRLRIRLSGPGIAATDGIAPELPGIALETFQQLLEVNADYPLGVDALFVRPDGQLMGLPRSTRIRVR